MGTERAILFVYGTLKRGERNHHLMRDQEYLGEAVTVPRYRVVDLGPYPGLIRDEVHGRTVHGELFAVDERGLAKLDAFEGVPDLYVREPIDVVGYPLVWAYYMNGPAPDEAKSGDRWPLE